MTVIVTPLVDPGYALQKALFKREFEVFQQILSQEKCTQHDLNVCLSFAAAVQGCGHYSRALQDAGADRQFYVNGRLDRSGMRGDLEKIDKWYGQGGDPHHKHHQPLRAALYQGQEIAAYYLVSAFKCSLEEATDPKVMSGMHEMENRDQIRNLVAKVRSRVGNILTLDSSGVRQLHA